MPRKKHKPEELEALRARVEQALEDLDAREKKDAIKAVEA